MRVLLVALLVLVAVRADADGGAVVAQETVKDLTVTVFVAPVPLRAGPIDVSVLLQRAGEPVLDADVALELSGGSRVVSRAPANHAEATNRLLYAAQLDVPAPGAWRLDVAVDAEGERLAIEALLEAAPALAPVSRFWAWLALPLLAVAAFLLHQRLAETQTSTKQ